MAQVVDPVEPIAKRHDGPIAVLDAALAGAAGGGKHTVILQASGYVVERLFVVRIDVIELRRRVSIQRLPRFRAIVGHGDLPVVRLPDAIVILRIDPDGMMVAVYVLRNILPSVAAIDGHEEAHGNCVESVLVYGVDALRRVVGPASQ